jgi:hypothetical protein
MPEPAYTVFEIQPEWVLDREALGSKQKFWYRAKDGEPEWLFKFPQPNTGEQGQFSPPSILRVRPSDGNSPLPWGEGVPLPAFSPAGAGRVRGQFRATRDGFPDPAHEFFRVIHHQSIRNSQQAYPEGSQKILFRRVSLHLTRSRVDTSIKLDRQSTFKAVEVDNPVFQSTLAAEFCAQLSAA